MQLSSIDGGVRRAGDIIKAVCLGAKAVGVGRPFLCECAFRFDLARTTLTRFRIRRRILCLRLCWSRSCYPAPQG